MIAFSLQGKDITSNIHILFKILTVDDGAVLLHSCLQLHLMPV